MKDEQEQGGPGSSFLLPPSSLRRGRLCIVAAAVLWSLSGGFAKALTQPTPLDVHEPAVPPLQMAFFRALFAGLVLLPMLRRRDLAFRPAMVPMGVCFAVMNALFVSALALGTAANAILLQYTAPMWMYLAAVWWLGEPADRRSSVTLAVGLLGIGVILSGPWWAPQAPVRPGPQHAEVSQLTVLAIALASGVTYAGVVLYLRVLRDLSSQWLTVWNHLCGAAVLLPWVVMLAPPTGPQMVVLFLFGAVQMGLPYWLMARGLRSVSPQEAGAITLLEPILNPVWAYLVSPETEKPTVATFVGGGLIVGGLAWRYWPERGKAKGPV
jgi:drug/metabolite transporter (DMT)-like permease